MGVLVFVGLIILLVFALKTRQKIRRWGIERILWEEPKALSGGVPHTIGEWVRGLPSPGDMGGVCVCVCMLVDGLSVHIGGRAVIY